MNNTIIVFTFKKMNYSALKDFAQTVHDGLAALSGVYTTPNPALTVLQGHIDDLLAAILAWGAPGNRGPHSALVALQAARLAVAEDLEQLALYCMNTTPDDAVNFALAGWETKAVPSPIGPLPGPPNLRVVISSVIVQGRIHYRWNKVRGAKSYKVWTGNGNSINIPPDPTQVYAVVTKTAYDDVAATPGTQRYIIVSPVGTNPNSGYSALAGQIVP